MFALDDSCRVLVHNFFTATVQLWPSRGLDLGTFSKELSMRSLLLIVSLFLVRQAEHATAERFESDQSFVAFVSPHTRYLLPEGKEVDAIDGDIILRNKHVIAVIARPVSGRDANLTTKNVGGFLIDLTTTEGGSDQLAYVQPGGSGTEFRSFAINPLQGEQTEYDPEAYNIFEQRNHVTVSTSDGETKAHYILPDESKALLVYVEGGGDRAALDFRIDGGADRVGVAGEGESDWFWAEDAYWGQAYGVRVTTGSLLDDSLRQWGLGLTGPNVRIQRKGRVSQLTFERPIESDGVPSRCFAITPAQTRLHARRALLPEQPSAELVLSYPTPERIDLSQHEPNVEAWVDVELSSRRGPKLTPIGKLRVRADQKAKIPVPTGPIEIASSRLGQPPVKNRVHFKSGDSVSWEEFLFESDGDQQPDAHPLTFTVDDEDGWPIPAKVEIRPVDGPRQLIDFGPDTAERRVHNLSYVVDGFEELILPEAKYELTASHGPEFHLERMTVDLSNEADRYTGFVMRRAFETPGWISADFHSHSSPSGDNISSQRGRVLNLVCEDIDFAPCTEHNRISSYQRHIDDLGIVGDLLSCTGIELTGSPLPLNHQNVFPLKHTPFAQNGGGPYTAADPDEQVERLYLWDNRAEKVIQQNHPDIGWLFRDRDGDGTHDEGFARAVGYLDCIEVHPIESALELFPDAAEAKGEAAKKWNRGRFLGWLQLLSQGRRLPGVVNTDAHYNFHGSGWLRNWIQVPNDEPSECDLASIIDSTKAGRVIMSNGPMLELTLIGSDGKEVGLGDELRSNDGQVTARVRVRCADWVGCDRVAVLVDGRPAKVFTTESTPNSFRDDVVVFEETIELSIDHDSPVLAICGSKSDTLGEVYGVDHAERNFAAATNPIWVNVGGEAWEPSNDTLDIPLAGKQQ